MRTYNGRFELVYRKYSYKKTRIIIRTSIVWLNYTIEGKCEKNAKNYG